MNVQFQFHVPRLGRAEESKSRRKLAGMSESSCGFLMFAVKERLAVGEGSAAVNTDAFVLDVFACFPDAGSFPI